MTALGPDWRAIDGVPTAWFATTSLRDAAALAARVGPSAAALDLRATGVRVRLDPADTSDTTDPAGIVSRAARELGLGADPGALQQLSVVLDSPDPFAVAPFWRRALDYPPSAPDALHDPLRRDPAILLRHSDEARPLRDRIHLDVVRPAAAVGRAGLGEASGPYGVRHADPDGNEVDLVPGDPLGADDTTADWQTVFSAMACYRVSPTQQRDLATAAAAAADDAGVDLLIDLRPGLVILDSGKDRWEADDADFAALAGRIQAAARERGAAADPGLARFVQVFLDAADVDAVRAFWLDALQYVTDPRDGVTDIFDPRRLNPELVFQELDAAETDRRRQRNRVHLELAVPADLAPGRLEVILAAGGRLLGGTDGRWRIADPEGNELELVAGS